MGAFGFTYATRKGTEDWPSDVPLPPIIRVRFEERPNNGFTHVGIKENDSFRLEIYPDDLAETLEGAQKEQFLAEAKQMATDKYLPRFADWARGQRDNIDRPSIGVIHHKQWADDEVIMDFYSHYNACRLDMTIRWQAWTAIAAELAIRNLDALCMLIFHSGNKITAVNMKCFESGKFKKLARLTQKYQNWGYDPIPVTQMCFDGTHAVILGKIIYDTTAHAFTRASGYMVGVGVREQRKMRHAGKVWVDAYLGSDDDPVLNGSGSSVYTLKSAGTVSSTQSVSMSSIDSLESPAVAYGVTSTGELLYSLAYRSTYIYANIEFYPERQSVRYADELPDSKWQAFGDELSAAVQSPFAVTTYGWSGRGDNIQTDYTTVRDGSGGGGPAKATMQVDGCRVVHSTAGGIDVVDYPVETLRAEVTAWNYPSTDAQSFNYGPISVSLGPTNDGSATLKQVMWPPSAFGDTSMWYRQDNVLNTPYGAGFSLQPWLHVSNGGHTIQGVVLDGARIVRMDGADFGGTLATCADDSIENIQCVYLGLPLSLLTKR